MKMIKRIRLLSATLFAVYCSSALGLGLGELELNSALNQRFDGEIVLTNVGALEPDEIIPNLASQADFDRVGVDRNYQLTDLRFQVRVRQDGQHTVLVTSSRPIIEPFLNFIVEVIWPTGRILREYTVLLDPPVFGTGGIEKIEPGQAASTPPPSSSTRKPQRSQAPAAPSVGSDMTEGDVTQDDEYGLTGSGDTLWTIALKIRPDDSVTVQQTMLALQRANPEAFINNNINLLKAGHVLRIPAASEIRAETHRDAFAEVRVQNQEFKGYKTGEVTQLDARRTSRIQAPASDDNDEGELKLLAADQSGSRAGADDARVGQLEHSLAVVREDLDRARRANTELNVRLDELAAQVETLNEIVKLKDDQLAALRAELQRSQSLGSADTAAMARAATTQPQTQDSLLTNPLVLGALAVMLIGGIAGAMIMLRKRRQAADLGEDDFPEVVIDEPAAEAGPAEEEPADIEPAEAEEDEEITQQTSDVIGEAEIYIAYGRFPQAISFLQNAIENEPERADIQLKLLEVYVQTEDAAAFNLQLEQLKMLGDEEVTSKALELQSQIPGAAETAAASMNAASVSAEPIDAIAEPMDDDDDEGEELSLDEAMDLDDADLDLDLDLDAETEETASDDDLDLDLYLDDDIDLNFDDDDAEETAGGEGLDLGDDDDALDLSSLEVDADDDELDFGGDEDALELDLDDDFDPAELEDEDLGELDLDEDVSSKLNLARAYVEMGDADGARALLQEVIGEGTEEEISKANELLGKLD